MTIYFDFYVYIRVYLGPQAHLDSMGYLELKDKQVLQEPLVLLDHQDQLAALDHREWQGHQERTVR